MVVVESSVGRIELELNNPEDRESSLEVISRAVYNLRLAEIQNVESRIELLKDKLKILKETKPEKDWEKAGEIYDEYIEELYKPSDSQDWITQILFSMFSRKGKSK